MTTKTKPTARRATFTVRRNRAEGDTYSMTIAANETSRNPFDEIRMDGGKFNNYLRNPVVLWSHDDHALPIGRTTALKMGDGELRADFEFLPDDPMAERVKRAWDLGFVNAASIRFMPLEVDTSDKSKPFGVVSKWELLEWSLVPIPADPDALRAAARALDIPEEMFRAEGDEEEPVDEPEEQPEEDEEPTVEERLAELESTVTDLTERIEALEDDEPEEEPEETPEEPAGESGEPMDERLMSQINDVLNAVRERK